MSVLSFAEERGLRMKLMWSAAIVAILSMNDAMAGSFVFSFGEDDVGKSNSAAAASLEYRFSPFVTSGPLSFGLGIATQVDQDFDFWIGAGPYGLYDFSEQWFLEAEVMPGYYDNGNNGTYLGSDFEFRLIFGVGYRLTHSSAVSLAVGHRSNAFTASDNPGVESLNLRYIHRF